MTGDVASIRYLLHEPFERAVASVRRSLVSRGLRVVGQLDISRRVERSLGIVLRPCRIVFVLPDPSVLSTGNIHPWATVFLPLHIVISGNGAQTEIQVQSRVHEDPEAATQALVRPVLETQALISEALEAIAMRSSMVV